MTPEIKHIEPIDDKSKPASEIIKLVNDEVELSPVKSVKNELEISSDPPVNNESKSKNKEAIPQPETSSPIYPTREQ